MRIVKDNFFLGGGGGGIGSGSSTHLGWITKKYQRQTIQVRWQDGKMYSTTGKMQQIGMH